MTIRDGTFLNGPVRVSVPATSANLGPGFDSLGLALELRDEITARVTGEELGVSITVDGPNDVPLSERNLVYRSMVRAFEAMQVAVPGISLHCENVIPHGRGLGSSSAAIVAGIATARALVVEGSDRLGDDEAFDLAVQIEGHPDNVAPAYFGGFTIAYSEAGRARVARLGVDPATRVVVFIPDRRVATRLARGLLPEQVSHADAAANSGRAALLVAALTGHPELLFDATRDYLHQEYRAPAMPDTLALVRRLRSGGHPAIVSGAGPTVLVFGTDDSTAALSQQGPQGWQGRVLDVATQGVLVLGDSHRWTRAEPE